MGWDCLARFMIVLEQDKLLNMMGQDGLASPNPIMTRDVRAESACTIGQDVFPGLESVLVHVESWHVMIWMFCLV